jgi:hypothetical protein
MVLIQRFHHGVTEKPLARVPRSCRVFCDRAGTLTFPIVEER